MYGIQEFLFPHSSVKYRMTSGIDHSNLTTDQHVKHSYTAIHIVIMFRLWWKLNVIVGLC